jgi:hypothetical protein
MYGAERHSMLGKFINFLIATIIVLVVAWVLTVVLGIIPVIPGNIKEIANLLIWAVAFIAILVFAKRVFIDGKVDVVS